MHFLLVVRMVRPDTPILFLLVGSLLLTCSLQFARAIVCYHCDSIALPECAQTLGEVGVLPYEDCTNQLSCAMSIVDTITYRGCGSDTPTTGATYSKSCSSNLCNAGVYPPGRLKCHHCAGVDCVGAPGAKPKPCRYHHEEDQCYTEVLSATEAYRGCVSEGNHTVSSAAKLCEYNGCNDEQGAWTQTCATCDSASGRGCKMDLFQVNSGRCNVSLYEECQQDVLLGGEEDKFCFSYRKLSRVVRGCSTALPAELEPLQDELDKCRTGDKCNAGCTPQQRCLTCNSVDQAACRSNVTAVSNSTCGSAEASSCFACEYSDWNIRRGCGAPPTDAGILNCYECDADRGCNSRDFTRCYRCSSDQAGAACANWERPGGIYIEECAQPGAPCLVLTHSNGTTERGCQREDFSCTSTSNSACKSCTGSFCNKGAFPEQRLWCHQCTGQQADCEQISRGSNAIPCPVQPNEPQEQAEACLEYFDTHKQLVVRGCRSNPQMYYECLLRSGHEDGCRLCHNQACNSSPGEDLRADSKLESRALELIMAKSSSSFTSTPTLVVCVIWSLFSIIYIVTARN
ncbi:variant-specific surface protein VSP4A1 [Drosophila madeirensis]|uniref:Variant-specific surface protein VSP4A1 n=1 Tax=Drosophila madeirensis TaxID=30013 RepID=A0AAU9FJQ8_DROMD